MENERMNPNMWELYRLIEEYTNKGIILRTETIAEKIPYYKGTSPRCPRIYEDIFLINNKFGWQHDKYIISNHNKFKLATKEEINKEYKRALKKYIKLNIICETLSRLNDLNGQYKLLSKSNEPIEETNSKETVESFSRK